MENVEKLFRAFYNQFVLRDLFAKVTPGAIFLLALTLSSASNPKELYSDLKLFEFWKWLVLVPVCWLTGITIQGSGAILPYIVFLRNHWRVFVFPDQWRQLYFNCLKNLGDDSERNQLERIVIIREASGIFFATLIFSFFVLRYGTTNYFGMTDILQPVFLVAILASSLMHLSMTQAQFDFMVRHAQAVQPPANPISTPQPQSTTPTTGAQPMLSANDAYSAFVQLVIHSEAISWNRFYNYLMAMTFLILAWATLYVQSQPSVIITVILASICILGALCGFLWAALGFRGRRFLDEYARAGSTIENDVTFWPAALNNFRPLTASRTLRDTLPFRYSGSMNLLTGVPLAVSLLYIILLIASLNR